MKSSNWRCCGSCASWYRPTMAVDGYQFKRRDQGECPVAGEFRSARRKAGECWKAKGGKS